MAACGTCGFANDDACTVLRELWRAADGDLLTLRRATGRWPRSARAAGAGLVRSSRTGRDGDRRRPGGSGAASALLFVDLENFTALAEHLDPEEVRGIQARYFEVARGVIASQWRHDREVHRRRRDGRLGRAGRPRGRRGASRRGGSRDRRRGRPPRRYRVRRRAFGLGPPSRPARRRSPSALQGRARSPATS